MMAEKNGTGFYFHDHDEAPLNLTLNMRLEPDMQEYVAQLIHGRLTENNLGRLSPEEGSGYMTNDDGEITECDFDIFADRMNELTVALIRENLNELPFIPKGSRLIWHDRDFPLGNAEILAVYLTVHCPDIDALIEKLCDALKGGGLSFFSSWSGETKTGLYFYGRDYGVMKQTVSAILRAEGLEQNCRLSQLA